MRIPLLIGILLLGAGAARAWSPEGYPGSTWGSVGRDLSGFEGNDTMGNVTQGVRWATLPGGLGLETYGSYRWRYRTQNQRFYDAQGPAAGVSLGKGPIDVGVDLAWRSYPQLDRRDRSLLYYLTLYKSVDFLKLAQVRPPRLLPGLEIPITTWGNLSHDLDGIEGDSVMGWVKIGATWFKYRKVRATTYGSYRVRSRTKNQLYYNASGPSVGLELGRAPLTLSVQYMWTRYEMLRRESNDLRLEATWYQAWDLKDLAKVFGKR